jgi:hypothetical protein
VYKSILILVFLLVIKKKYIDIHVNFFNLYVFDTALYTSIATPIKRETPIHSIYWKKHESIEVFTQGPPFPEELKQGYKVDPINQ